MLGGMGKQGQDEYVDVNVEYICREMGRRIGRAKKNWEEENGEKGEEWGRGCGKCRMGRGQNHCC